MICLLSTRRWLTKDQIRRAVPDYAESPSAQAFDRMFERDKEELRELGVPIATRTVDVLADNEIGYRINRDDYALADVRFTPEELSVLGIASRVWQQASLGAPAARAMVKLKALGVAPDDAADDSMIGVEPRVRTVEPAFAPLFSAVRDRQAVRFHYRAASTGLRTRRTVEPWTMRNWHGAWYLAGFDRDRSAPRLFRLSRITDRPRPLGEPDGYERPGHEQVDRLFADVTDQPVQHALLAVRRGRAKLLRQHARPATPPAGAAPAGLPADYDLVHWDFTDTEQAAAEVCSFGPDAVALAPEPLSAACRRLLRGAAGLGEER